MKFMPSDDLTDDAQELLAKGERRHGWPLPAAGGPSRAVRLVWACFLAVAVVVLALALVVEVVSDNSVLPSVAALLAVLWMCCYAAGEVSSGP